MLHILELILMAKSVSDYGNNIIISEPPLCDLHYYVIVS